MKTAIVGCNGLLGNALMRLWQQQSDDDVVALDYPDCDITTRLLTLDQFQEIAPDVIINTTGISQIDWLEKRPNTARTVHIQGTANLREAAKRTKSKLVHISCCEVFGNASLNKMEPFSEDDLPEPESVFAKTKWDSERAASEWENHLIIRTSTLFGKLGTNSTGNMVESICHALRRKEPLNIISDVPSSPTWSDDLAKAVFFLVKNDKRGLFHIANREYATPYEISQEILKLTGLKRDFRPITAQEYGFAAPRAVHTMLYSTKYHQLEGCFPMPRWRDSLRDYLSTRAAVQ